MECRYEDVNDNVVEVYMKIIEEYFPEIGNLKIKLIFDLKKKITKGKLSLAYVELVNEKLKFLTASELIEGGYDILLVINKVVWELADDKDKVRIMRHELRHIFEDENDKLTLLPHDIEDFSAEIELNKDNSNWARNLVSAAKSKYDEMKGEK